MKSPFTSVATRKGKMATVSSRGNKLYINYSINGKRIRRSTGLDDTPHNREKLEKEIIPALMEKIRLGEIRSKSSNTFHYYFEKFLAMHSDDKSYHNQIYVYKKVDAHFGKMQVGRITRLTVKEYLNSLPVKNKTKRDYLLCIRGVLDIAIDDAAIETNVALGIKFKREEKQKVEVFSNDEVAALLEKAEPMLRNYLAIAFYTGMRTGEILGIMRQDIHENYIEVKRSISKGRITTPKTIGSVRDVPIFKELKPYIEDQLKRSTSLYLFDKDGHYIKDGDFFRKRWRKALRDTGIPYRKIYATRHTFITNMLNSGKFKIMEIAAIVGHSSPQMIMQNYAGFIKDSHLKIDTNFSLFGKENGTVLTQLENLNFGERLESP